MKRKETVIRGLDDALLKITEEVSKGLEKRHIDRMDVARALYGISTGVFLSKIALNPDYIHPVLTAFSISRSIDEDSRPVNENLSKLKKLGYATMWMAGITGTLALLTISHYPEFKGKDVMAELWQATASCAAILSYTTAEYISRTRDEQYDKFRNNKETWKKF